MKRSSRYFVQLIALILLGCNSQAEGLNPQAQSKVDQILKEVQDWVKTPALIEAVETQDRQLPPPFVAMTQEKWETLPEADPFVHGFTTNVMGEFLKQKRTKAISEAFLSDAGGYKIAFLSKTTTWCHKGKPKHDVPMSGHPWQGKVEVDRSTGGQQLQIAVPVFADSKPIGSLVIGIAVSALVAE